MLEQISVRDVRNVNKNNIIRSMMTQSNLSRYDIATRNNISIMTVKNIVDDLLKNNIIYETKVEESVVGRKPSVLNITEAVGFILTVDLTSKNLLKYIVYNIHREKIKKGSYKCRLDRPYADNLDDFLKILKNEIEQLNSTIVIGIGVAVPGIYLPKEDRVCNKLIDELNRIKLEILIKRHFDSECIVIDHDVKLAAFAEVMSMEKDYGTLKDLYYIFLGEGVGGAFAIRGEIFEGFNEIAGDIGQTIICCDSDVEYNLESILSITALIKGIRDKLIESGLKLEMSNDEFDFDAILKMYNLGDSVVSKYFENVFKIFTRVIYNVIWLINPEKIIIGSLYCEFGEIAVEQMNRNISNMLKSKVPLTCEICVSKYDENSSLIGCFEMIVNKWLKSL